MKHPRYLLSGLALSMLVASGGAQAAGLTSEHKPFGKTNDGTAVEQYVLRNSHGMQATVITYGGVLQSLKVPDKHGKVEDVVRCLRARRQALPGSAQRWPQLAAWRRPGLRQARMESHARQGQGLRGRDPHLPVQGR